MSWQACKYARYVLEDDTELTTGARLILMLCAERANRDTGATFGGGWLCRAANLHPANVRKYLHELDESGLIRLCGNRGKALEIRFPIVEALSTPHAGSRALVEIDPARDRAQPRAIPRVTPRDPTRHTGLLPSSYPADVEPVAKLSRSERERLIQEGKKSAHG